MSTSVKLDIQGKAAYAYTGGKAFDTLLPTVVFIHGAQNDHSVWGLQSRWFAHHGYGVLAVDLPGHGRSSGPALSSVEEMADWLLTLLDALGVRKPLLVGHSMGSLIALEAAHRAPGKVRALAMLGTTYPMKVSDALLATARDDENRAIDMVNIWSHSSIAHKPSSPAPGFSVMGGARRLMQRMSALNPAQLFYTDFSACNAYANGEAAAAAVRCPTLFIFGKKDMMTPARSTRVLTGAIAHGKVVQVDAGHSLMSEQPDAVLDALDAFALSLEEPRDMSFAEFYPFYLTQHADRRCRRTHFIGSTGALLALATALVTGNAWWVPVALVFGYGGAWIGHFFYEHNRPATFAQPWLSFRADWVMYWQMLTGKLSF